MEEKTIDMIKLATLRSPIKRIHKHLSLIDSIKLASTNTIIRDNSIPECKQLGKIHQISCFDFNTFLNNITRTEIEIIKRTFPEIRKLKIDLEKADDHLLDNLSIFTNLQKLSCRLGQSDHNFNLNPLGLKAITCHAEFYLIPSDPIFTLLRQISNTKSVSVHKGHLSLRTLTLIETRKLEILKIHNTIIKNCSCVVRIVLHNENLTYLKITTDNYILSPYHLS